MTPPRRRDFGRMTDLPEIPPESSGNARASSTEPAKARRSRSRTRADSSTTTQTDIGTHANVELSTRVHSAVESRLAEGRRRMRATTAQPTSRRVRATLYLSRDDVEWLDDQARELGYQTRGAITKADITAALFAAAREMWPEIEAQLKES